MRFLRAGLIFIHRYLGIALCLLFVTWFVSGIAMIYARDMPRLTPEARLQHLTPIDLSRVRVQAQEAAARAGLANYAGAATLLMVTDRPAYRFQNGRLAV